MKILICGLGSIGQRHARNLRALHGDDVELLAYRVRGLPHVITAGMTLDDGSTVEQAYDIRSFDHLNAALAARPDAVFVCNPTSQHVSTAIAAVESGCHVFIEKALGDTYDGVERLIDLAERRRVVAVVGYQLRFHPAFRQLRQWLAERAIGRLTSVRSVFSEYLPDAHPYEDYRQSYAARRDLGGGVILSYIHEFDYLCWLFGMPRRVFTTGGRLGRLDVDVEDTASTLLECEDDGRPLPIHVHQSFAERQPARSCTVAGECGVIHFDLRSNRLTLTNTAGAVTREVSFEPFERNLLFLDELRSFCDAMQGQSTPLVGLREGAQSLRVALAARESLERGVAVEIGK